MAKILTLDVEEEQQFKLIGLISPEPDFKLAFLINKHCSFYFQRAEQDVSFVDPKSKAKSSFALYEYNDENLMQEWFLVANKFTKKENGTADLLGTQATINSFLVKDHKQADYFIQTDIDCVPSLFRTVLKSIKAIPNVIAAYEIDPENLKHKEHLYYLHEKHEQS